MIKKIITIFCISILFSTHASAFDEEEITLPPSAIYHNTMPVLNPKEYKNEQLKKIDNNYLENDEDVFDSKAGKFFSKFIDETIVNNKINRTYFNDKSSFYEERIYENIE